MPFDQPSEMMWWQVNANSCSSSLSRIRLARNSGPRPDQGRRSLFPYQHGGARLRIRDAAQIVDCQRQTGDRQNERLRLAVAADKDGAQRVVARIKRVEAALPGGQIQRPTQPQRQRHVVNFAHAVQLGQEPQALLSERQR